MSRSRTVRDERAGATREALLDAAERLFAERGIHAVSNRQISEAAGQGNNAAVSYHFGTKADVVRAIIRRHAVPMEGARVRMLEEIGDSADLRDWVACLVRPVTGHLDDLGTPSWYARFTVQAMADPALYEIMIEESFLASPSLPWLSDGLARHLPELPVDVHQERAVMARHLILQMAAERERALAENRFPVRPTWRATADGLIDAIVALWRAPVTR
ncbi:helix-turn-helix domain-containing protein [Spirillospora sp. NPDC029432]|uniref:TetR/AcrR family transcriptional regulator n=1 Tax=Spirillospora sp. NPDC029432 TaxID=3154599 RepID=UPI003454D17E